MLNMLVRCVKRAVVAELAMAIVDTEQVRIWVICDIFDDTVAVLVGFGCIVRVVPSLGAVAITELICGCVAN